MSELEMISDKAIEAKKGGAAWGSLHLMIRYYASPAAPPSPPFTVFANLGQCVHPQSAGK